MNMPVDAETESFIETMTGSPGPGPGEIPIEQFRAGMARFREFDFDEREMAQVDDVPAGDGLPVAVRVYRPTLDQGGPALIWAHGGSWMRGSLDTHDRLLRTVALGARCTVISVDYSLAPEHQFPRGLEDVYAVACWAADSAAIWGWDPTRLAVGGDSSGAALAAGAGLLARERGGVRFALQALLMPVLDLSLSSASWETCGDGRYLLSAEQLEWAISQYAPGQDVRTAPLSPLRASSFSDLPPALVVVGGSDPCRDDGVSYASGLRSATVDVVLREHPALIHHAMLAPKRISAGRHAVEQFATDVRAQLWRTD